MSTKDSHHGVDSATSESLNVDVAPPSYEERVSKQQRPTSPSKSPHPKPRSKPRKVIGNYTLVTTLGSGSMGKVKLAMHNLTHDKLAVKIVPRSFAAEAKNDKDENREVRTIREASIMLLLYHPHIVSLKELVVLDPYYYLFMEYVGGGQLLDYIISHGKLKEKHARRFARQIVSALDYCHRNSIVHRDLKIENILISQSGHVKIIDFGLSNLFSPRSHLSTFCGSLYFAAPELLHAKAYTGPEVDVWSFGIVLYVLVCGKVPFDDQSMPALHAKIKRGHVDYPSHLSSECKNLLSRMLVTNPNHRATISEIIVHPWMNRGYDNPIDNHLPDRAPLMLPVDMDVIRNMTGFGFGTEAEIKQQLESIITSEEYQKAAKTLAKRSRQTHHTSASRVHSPIPSRKPYSMPNDDPQSIPAAYHPLVSIYYLVKERIERERRATASDPDNPRTSTSSMRSFDESNNRHLRIPDISIPETAHPADSSPFEHEPYAANSGEMFNHSNKPIGPTTTGIAFGRRGRTNIRIDDEGHIVEADRPNILESGLHRLISRPPFGRTSESSSTEENENDHHHHGNVFKRLSNAIQHHRSSLEQRRNSRNSTELSPMSTSSTTRKDVEVNSPTNTGSGGSSLGTKVSHLLGRAGSTTTTESHHKRHPQRRPRQATVSGSNPLTENRVASGKAPAQSLPQEFESHEHVYPSTTSRPQGTADETVKQVFLKGLFSVTTTSTKHPSVIRADLIRVLERIGVKWRESKGRFECVHMPSIDMNRVTDKKKDEVPEQENNNTGAITVPDLVVRFEIYIVKVSWLLGMHGLQFRRVSGDPWLYKNMCSRILAELKL
ncbi:kinase-like domain-containing protein [Fennellomyces sp. T-0311]|nr:kinase-like domain-containing protein [Fennellomyces sp. T-0311]